MMTATLDQIMETASEALVKMDYLKCESLCLQALGAARERGDWNYYARILLPLQEARRQRRIIAAEGEVRLGTTELDADLRRRLVTLSAGSVVLTRPCAAEEAHAMMEHLRSQQAYVEVLFADNEASDSTWVLRSFAGPVVSCVVKSPPKEWINRWLAPGDVAATPGGKTPGDWVIDATESLGDAALKHADNTKGAARVEALEACLKVVTDHEIIHQRLAEAARQLSAGRTG